MYSVSQILIEYFHKFLIISHHQPAAHSLNAVHHSTPMSFFLTSPFLPTLLLVLHLHIHHVHKLPTFFIQTTTYCTYTHRIHHFCLFPHNFIFVSYSITHSRLQIFTKLVKIDLLSTFIFTSTIAPYTKPPTKIHVLTILIAVCSLLLNRRTIPAFHTHTPSTTFLHHPAVHLSQQLTYPPPFSHVNLT